jgi:hypothetical protein
VNGEQRINTFEFQDDLAFNEQIEAIAAGKPGIAIFNRNCDLFLEANAAI